jgi:hypothetical protein
MIENTTQQKMIPTAINTAKTARESTDTTVLLLMISGCEFKLIIWLQSTKMMTSLHNINKKIMKKIINMPLHHCIISYSYTDV